MKTFILAILLTSLSLQAAFGQNDKPWPKVQSFSKIWHIPDTSETDADTPVLAYIRDMKGTPVYKLECHSGDYSDQSEMNFSGDFQCALFAVKGNTLVSGNLLAANTKNEQSADWWNRGRMRSVQLRGECLKYPEYSTVRHFKLRGMLLTLRFAEVEWSSAKDQQNNPLVGKFTFTANVVPDPTVKSSRAEEVEGPAPPTSCYP